MARRTRPSNVIHIAYPITVSHIRNVGNATRKNALSVLIHQIPPAVLHVSPLLGSQLMENENAFQAYRRKEY